MEKNNICGKCIHFIMDDLKNLEGHCPFHRDVEFPEHESCGEFSDTLPSKPPSDIITNRRMDPMGNKDDAVPFRAYESALSRIDRHVRWLIIIIIILVVALVASNMAWLYVWNQYEYEYTDDYSVDIQSDDGSNANYISGNGDINNGGTNSSNEAQEADTQEALNAKSAV